MSLADSVCKHLCLHVYLALYLHTDNDVNDTATSVQKTAYKGY